MSTGVAECSGDRSGSNQPAPGASSHHIRFPTFEPTAPMDVDLTHFHFHVSPQINSVYFYKDPKDDGMKAAVLLDIEFDHVEGHVIDYARLDMCITGLGVDQVQSYPSRGQAAEVGSGSDNALLVAPSVQGPGGMGVSLGSYLRRWRNTGRGVWYLFRVKESNTQIRWVFKNEHRHESPDNIFVVLIVFGDVTQLPFPFTLELLPTLKIKLRSKRWWNPFKTTFRPEKGHRGWRCQITADGSAYTVQGALEQVKDEPERELGLVGLIRRPRH